MAEFESVALPVDDDGRPYITEIDAVLDSAFAAMVQRQSNFWRLDVQARVWRGPIPEKRDG